MYIRKLFLIKDKQLPEFNFKVMNSILPCNVNLVWWQKKAVETCNICGINETIEHILFSCQYAAAIWQSFNNLTGMRITLNDIIIGDDLIESYNFVVTLLAFLIYKKWLLESMNNVPCINIVSIDILKPDLKYRAQVYEHLQWYIIDINSLCN